MAKQFRADVQGTFGNWQPGPEFNKVPSGSIQTVPREIANCNWVPESILTENRRVFGTPGRKPQTVMDLFE